MVYKPYGQICEASLMVLDTFKLPQTAIHIECETLLPESLTNLSFSNAHNTNIYLSGVSDDKVTWALDIIASITDRVDVMGLIEFYKSNISKKGFKKIMKGLQKLDVEIENLNIKSPHLTPACETAMNKWLVEHYNEDDVIYFSFNPK